jgi:uncharacterized hydrophobic protein (TIGR00271 family)
MIISPLMWPLMKVAVGVLFSQRVALTQAVSMLLLAVIICLISSALITLISPIKFINAEILARTNPTLIDVFVALSAGSVAAFAITHKRISENLAGIAVATSLMPPLNVSGIGLALSRYDIFWGGFLLFSTNVLSIILACLVVFAFLGIRRQQYTKLSLIGTGLIVISLFILTVPLARSLIQTATQRTIFQQTRLVLEENLASVSPGIIIDSVKTTLPEHRDQPLLIEAELLLPESVTVTFSQQEELVGSLESALERPVSLQLFLKPTLSVKSEQNTELELDQQRISRQLSSLAQQRSFTLRSLETQFNQDRQTWQVTALLGVSGGSMISERDRQELEHQLDEVSRYRVVLDLELVSLVELLSEPELIGQRMRNHITDYFQSISPQVEVTSIDISDQLIVVSLLAPDETEFNQSLLDQLNLQLEQEFDSTRPIRLEIVRKSVLEN